MIRTLIIEDEEPAWKRLSKMLVALEPEIEIIDTLDSVESAIRWLNSHHAPDLLILDIQLADGQSFDIFKKVTVDSFVIFTTAYDEYAIKAFELNSIDYLLKPIDEQKLKKSLDKYKLLKKPSASLNINELISAIESRKANYKKRFLINVGQKIKSIETHDIAFFYVLEKSTFLCTSDGHNFPIDFSLDKLEELIDPDLFFRINRQYMISFNSIQKISVLSKSRIRIETSPKAESELLVSANKTHEFRLWLDR